MEANEELRLLEEKGIALPLKLLVDECMSDKLLVRVCAALVMTC